MHLRLRCASRQTVQKWQRHGAFHTPVRLVSSSCITKVLIADLNTAAGFGSEEELGGAAWRWHGSSGQTETSLATPEEAAVTTTWAGSQAQSVAASTGAAPLSVAALMARMQRLKSRQ